MREERQIEKVKSLIENYKFDQPFSGYLKQYFRKNPVMGARDRRETREWSYNLMRIGDNLSDFSFEMRLSIACFLCSTDKYQSLTYLVNKYSGFDIEDIDFQTERKVEWVSKKYPSFSLEKIFPMHEYLSPSIDREKWFISFLKKPRVWIRMRKNRIAEVKTELEKNTIPFTVNEDPTILSFYPEVALEKTESWAKGYFEIQDISSQATKKYFSPNKNEKWWDACSGSGGKSLLLLEEENEINLFATDNRKQMVEIYKERLKKAGFLKFHSTIADLTKEPYNVKTTFDGIIADVPCSGSGTWTRSPEWLQIDISQQIKHHFVPVQRQIVANCIDLLASGKPIIYITCSAFFEENEENIRFFIENLPLQLEKSSYIEGFNHGADTLFAARLIKK